MFALRARRSPRPLPRDRQANPAPHLRELRSRRGRAPQLRRARAPSTAFPVTTVTNHLAWARRELRRLVRELDACELVARLRPPASTLFCPTARSTTCATTRPVGTRYEIERGDRPRRHGVVYRARDTQLDRLVALKVIEAGPLDEARTLARLEHPGPRAGLRQRRPARRPRYYAMRLVQGKRLDEFLRDEPALPARLRVFEKICEAVAFAHRSRRGPLRPQAAERDDRRVRRGLRHGLGDRQQRPCPPPARRTTACPEAVHTPRSDIFSLGRILEDFAPSAPPAGCGRGARHGGRSRDALSHRPGTCRRRRPLPRSDAGHGAIAESPVEARGPVRPPQSRAAASAGDVSRGKVRVGFSVPHVKGIATEHGMTDWRNEK